MYIYGRSLLKQVIQKGVVKVIKEAISLNSVRQSV